jgi:hypothetical protein
VGASWVWARERDPRKVTHIAVFDPESLGHFFEELVLLAVEFERLLYLVFLAAAGVAALLLGRPDVVQQLFLCGT